MIRLITATFHESFGEDLAEMHRLRHRVFKDRLDWAVAVRGDQETDRFDALQPHYLLLCSRGRLAGSVRFLPTTGPTMLSEIFADLLDGAPAPASPSIWESSRFALEVAEPMETRRAGLARETYALFAGMIEFGLFLRLAQIVTVTDVRMERILRRAGWPLKRLGVPRQIGSAIAIAGYLQVSPESLATVRWVGGLQQPVLWIPALADSA
jgi:acyl homoserine lactone synthase